MLKSLKQVRKPKLLLDSKDVLPLCFVGLTIFSLISFLFLLFLSFKVNQLAARKTTFVQLVNGRALVISEQHYLYRHPEVIKNTVRQWANLTFNWDGVIPGTKELDKGRNLGKGKRVTTNAYIASFLIQSGKSGLVRKFIALARNTSDKSLVEIAQNTKVSLPLLTELGLLGIEDSLKQPLPEQPQSNN